MDTILLWYHDSRSLKSTTTKPHLVKNSMTSPALAALLLTQSDSFVLLQINQFKSTVIASPLSLHGLIVLLNHAKQKKVASGISLMIAEHLEPPFIPMD